VTWENEEIAPEPPKSRTRCDTSHLVPVSDQAGPITRSIELDPSYGHAPPRDDARLTKVTKVDPQTGNAIQIYVPPGCDLSLPMIGDN
jgi:hypothetical protein